MFRKEERERWKTRKKVDIYLLNVAWPSTYEWTLTFSRCFELNTPFIPLYSFPSGTFALILLHSVREPAGESASMQIARQARKRHVFWNRPTRMYIYAEMKKKELRCNTLAKWSCAGKLQHHIYYSLADKTAFHIFPQCEYTWIWKFWILAPCVRFRVSVLTRPMTNRFSLNLNMNPVRGW